MSFSLRPPPFLRARHISRVSTLRTAPLGSRLSWRVAWRVMLLSLIFTILSAVVQVYVDYRKDFSDIIENVDRVNRNLSSALSRAIWFFDSEAVRLTLDGMLQFPDVTGVRIVAGDEVLYQAGESKSGDAREISFPLVFRQGEVSESVGTAVISVTHRGALQRTLERASVTIGTQALLVFLLAGFVLSIVFSLVTRHLEQVARHLSATHRSSLLNPLRLRRRVKVGHEDELDALVNAVNSMQRNLHQSYTELQELVAQRDLSMEIAESARDKAEEASRIKDEFIMNLSHELRTPLNAIMGWSDLMRQAGGNPEIQEKGLRIIETSTRTQLRLVEDLLDLSKILSGRFAIKLARCSLSQLIEHVVDSFALPAAAKGIVLTRQVETGLCVSGDEVRLQQVAWNLISNALRFTGDGGQIRITLRPEDGMARLEVSDSGEGICADFLPYVFDRFRQEDGSLTRRHGGLGVGLAIAHSVVEFHGGDIQAFSDGKGCGARFVVRIPLSRGGGEME